MRIQTRRTVCTTTMVLLVLLLSQQAAEAQEGRGRRLSDTAAARLWNQAVEIVDSSRDVLAAGGRVRVNAYLAGALVESSDLAMNVSVDPNGKLQRSFVGGEDLRGQAVGGDGPMVSMLEPDMNPLLPENQRYMEQTTPARYENVDGVDLVRFEFRGRATGQETDHTFRGVLWVNPADGTPRIGEIIPDELPDGVEDLEIRAVYGTSERTKGVVTYSEMAWKMRRFVVVVFRVEALVYFRDFQDIEDIQNGNS